MKSATNLMIGLGLAFAFGACTDTNSATNLNAAGPPMLRQVRMNSKTFNADGSSSTARVFGFGSHEQATADELKSNQVTHANAVNNTFRLIIDDGLTHAEQQRGFARRVWDGVSPSWRFRGRRRRRLNSDTEHAPPQKRGSHRDLDRRGQ